MDLDNVLERLRQELAKRNMTVDSSQPEYSRNGARSLTLRITTPWESKAFEGIWVDTFAPSHISRALSSSSTGLQPLFMTAKIKASEAEDLTSFDFDFADSAGNMRINLEHSYIEIFGRKLPKSDKTPSLSHSAQPNLFSSRSAQVIFALISWPTLVREPIREIGRVSGVSTGQAHKTLELLREAGYLDGESYGRGLRSVRELFDTWASTYGFQLGRSLDIARFSADNFDMYVPGTSAVWLSGEVAARSSLRPTTATIYVDELDPMLPLANRWRTDREPNTFVRRKFWRDPSRGELRAGLQRAPVALVYADLVASNDPRQREVAHEMREVDPELFGLLRS